MLLKDESLSVHIRHINWYQREKTQNVQYERAIKLSSKLTSLIAYLKKYEK